jgi:hypothetical protein
MKEELEKALEIIRKFVNEFDEEGEVSYNTRDEAEIFLTNQQEQAKEMEKVKIINTLVEFSKAHFDIHTEEAISYITKKAEKYYNKQFKQQEQ